ncbi:unnamed protein product [Rhizophagus irregularis]|nr:unnamed protein product [Rhizophagus irregularis]
MKDQSNVWPMILVRLIWQAAPQIIRSRSGRKINKVIHSLNHESAVHALTWSQAMKSTNKKKETGYILVLRTEALLALGSYDQNLLIIDSRAIEPKISYKSESPIYHLHWDALGTKIAFTLANGNVIVWI